VSGRFACGFRTDLHFADVLLSLGLTQSSADPNLYLDSNRILVLLYVDDISMSYLEAATKAAIEVKEIH
jgi:hypothetical protein